MSDLTFNEPAFTKRIKWTSRRKDHSFAEGEGVLLGHTISYFVGAGRQHGGAPGSVTIHATVDGETIYNSSTLGGGTRRGIEVALENIRTHIAVRDLD